MNNQLCERMRTHYPEHGCSCSGWMTRMHRFLPEREAR